MNRRSFLHLPLLPALTAAPAADAPSYRIATRYAATGQFGMPGPYPGRVVSAHSNACIDASTRKVNAGVVREMLSGAMRSLTGKETVEEAWGRFFHAEDVVGIKLNCSGAPNVCSTPEVVAEIVHNLIGVGVKPGNIYLYERFENQIATVPYTRFLPAGVNIHAVEHERGSNRGYDPYTYVEVNFFGEEDTRSNLVRLVSERLTKIVNVPNMKDHGAAGVTGCLKNIAYGNFSNVARSHRSEKTNTLTFIGTLAAVEPLRSKTVLHVMDGLTGVWHGGPFVLDRRFVFHPKQIIVGTDPVAIDRQLLDTIEEKRRAEGAPSVWDRSPQHLREEPAGDPNFNRFIREPGHIEYASRLGLGTYNQNGIRYSRIEIA